MNAARKEGKSRTQPITQPQAQAQNVVNNLVKTLKLQTIRPISRAELPVSRGHGKATLHILPCVLELTRLLDGVVQNGLNPHEIVAEIEVSGPEVDEERGKRKSFDQSLRKLLRKKVKDSGLDKQVEIMEFNRGERYFVVGRAL